MIATFIAMIKAQEKRLLDEINTIELKEYLIFNQIGKMFYLLLSLGVLYWLGMSIFCHRNLKKLFKKYKDTLRLQVPQKYNAFLRKDFGKWDQKALIKRSFTHFPLRFTVMLSALVIYAILGTLHTYIKFPPFLLINAFRKYYGKLAMKLIVNVRQQFDISQKIQTPIIISNHSTFMDILYFGFCLQSIVSFVSKKEIQQLPVIREVAKFIQTILLDRSSAEARAKVRLDIEERVRMFEKDNQNVYPLLIFPEGTVSNGRSLMQFKNGAFQALSPITIFSLRYQSKQFHMGDNELGFLEHILMTVCAKCDLIVNKKVVQPTKNETVDQYKQRCQKELAKMGNFKIYECGYRDYLQYDKLYKAKLASLKNQKSPQKAQ